MASSGSVRVRIEAETSGVTRGISATADALHNFEKGTTRAERGAKAFAGAIASITGASGGATGAIATMLSGFAFGGPAGLAIGGVQALISAIGDIRKESAESAKKAAEHARQIGEAMQAAAEDVGRARFVAAGGKASDYNEVLKNSKEQAKADEERIRAQGELAKAMARVAQQRRVIANLESSGQEELSLPAERETLKQYIDAEAQAREAVRKTQEWKANLAETTSRAIDATTQTETDRIKEEERKKRNEYVKTAETRLAAAKAADKETVDRIKAELDAEADAANERGQITAWMADWEIRQAKKARDAQAAEQKKINADKLETIQLTQQWGEELGYVAAQYIAGGMSAQQAGAQVLAMVLKTAMANAMDTVIKAGKSEADVPIVGPALAAAAMAAMMGLVMGYISQIPGRRYGGAVLAGMPYLVGEEGPEVIVPGASGTVIPNKRIGGGSGGPAIAIYANGIIDSGTLGRTVLNASGDYARATRKLKRQRRI